MAGVFRSACHFHLRSEIRIRNPARSIDIGVGWRTGARTEARRWCSGMCCISRNSTPASRPPGARRSELMRRALRFRARLRCFQRSALQSCPTMRWFAFGWTSWNCGGCGNRAPAGWPVISIRSWGWMRFWTERLKPNGKGRRWDHVLQTLVAAALTKARGHHHSHYPIGRRF